MGNFNFDLSRVQTRSNFLSKTILKVGNQLLIVYTNIKKKIIIYHCKISIF